MGFFKKNSIMNIIRCDEKSYLIWKWRPSNSELGEDSRENSIRFGSSLRVKDGELAVFVYRHDNNIVQDIIAGPFDKIIETKNLPVISGIVEKLYGGNSPFQAEVYFINLAAVNVRFGVPYFDVYDYKYPEFSVPVAVRGTVNVAIMDYKEFISCHRLINFTIDDFSNQIRDVVNNCIKSIVSNFSKIQSVPVLQIENSIYEISQAVKEGISEKIFSMFGATVINVDISDIEIDKASSDYSQLLAVSKDITLSTRTAEAQANINNIREKQRIDINNYEETLRIQREESQYAQRKQTQSANFAAYQTEVQSNIGIAGAEALGKMNSSHCNFNPLNLISGLVTSQAIGNNIASAINNVSNGNVNISQQVPPPMPEIRYHIAIEGNASGPYNISSIKEMIESGKISPENLFWKPGMSEWKPATEIEELKSLFNQFTPPPIR